MRLLIRLYKSLKTIDFVVLAGLLLGVSYGWQGLEVLYYGSIQYRRIDDFIATLLVISLFLNYMLLTLRRR